MDQPDEPDLERLGPEEFEDIVAALLKVDPEGITGQKAAKKKPHADDSPESD